MTRTSHFDEMAIVSRPTPWFWFL